MTAATINFAALSSAEIAAMTAALTGEPVKRAASRAAAVARYERAVAAAGSVTLAAPAPVAEEPVALVEEVAAPAPAKPARARKVAGKRAPVASAKGAKAKAKPARKPAAEKPAATPGEPRAGSKRATILSMVRRAEGATAEEICAALGWVQCGATLSRVLRGAGVVPRKVRDEPSGRLRYFAA